MKNPSILKKNTEIEVLRLLEKSNSYISGETIASKLNISRSAIWKQICKLREEGFFIDAYPRLGYRLITCPEKLITILTKDKPNTFLIGQDIYYYKKTDSTNSIANELAVKGAKEGTVVIAEEQTMGRGRQGRNWLSPAYKNILMSIIFRPILEPSKSFFMTMISSLAIVNAIRNITAIKAQIKWPNDIYIGEKKIGGILTELNAEQDRLNFVIVGIGINVNFNPSIYSDIKDTATSILNIKGEEIPRVVLLQSILEEMEKYFNFIKAKKINQIRNEWNTHSLIIGKSIRITSFDICEDGIAEYVDEDGCLIIRDEKGKRKRILSGDVSLKLR